MAKSTSTTPPTKAQRLRVTRQAQDLAQALIDHGKLCDASAASAEDGRSRTYDASLRPVPAALVAAEWRAKAQSAYAMGAGLEYAAGKGYLRELGDVAAWLVDRARAPQAT